MFIVIPGLDPGIHAPVAEVRSPGVDGRVKPGHDGFGRTIPGRALIDSPVPSAYRPRSRDVRAIPRPNPGSGNR